MRHRAKGVSPTHGPAGPSQSITQLLPSSASVGRVIPSQPLLTGSTPSVLGSIRPFDPAILKACVYSALITHDLRGHPHFVRHSRFRRFNVRNYSSTQQTKLRQTSQHTMTCMRRIKNADLLRSRTFTQNAVKKSNREEGSVVRFLHA